MTRIKKTPMEKTKLVKISCYVTPELRAAFKSKAYADGKDVSIILREFIEIYLNNGKKNTKIS